MFSYLRVSCANWLYSHFSTVDFLEKLQKFYEVTSDKDDKETNKQTDKTKIATFISTLVNGLANCKLAADKQAVLETSNLSTLKSFSFDKN